MVQERDYIGPDPLKWVERLRDVARDSNFNDADKALIETTLYRLACKLAEK